MLTERSLICLLGVALMMVLFFFTPQFKAAQKEQTAELAELYWREFKAMPEYTPTSSPCDVLPRQAKLSQISDLLNHAQKARIPIADSDLKNFKVLEFRETFRAVNIDLGTAFGKKYGRSLGSHPMPRRERGSRHPDSGHDQTCY